MKKILLGLLMLVSISVTAQVKRDKFIEKYAGNLKITYQRTTDIENNDTRYGVFLSFQNDKYKTLTDIKVIGLYSVADIDAIVKDMKIVFKQMFSGEKNNMDWTRDKYKMTLYDFTTSMYFTEAKTGGYTIMDRRAVSDFIEIISTINFGKDTLLPSKTIDELIP
jgi:hypothetical protein